MKFKKANFKQGKISSLITRNGFYFSVILIGIILATYVGALWYVQASLPIIRVDELMKKVPKMTDTDFAHMNKKYYLGENGTIILLDGNGSTIYTNDVTYYSDFLASELSCIQEYSVNTSRHLTEFETLDGKKQYLLIEEIDNYNDINKVQGYALFDQDYNILEGTLFPECNKFTKEEFSWLFGAMDNTYSTRKYTYQNVLGDTRILVFTTQNNLISGCLSIMNHVVHWLLALILIIILLTLGYSLMLGKKISQLILPINQAIQDHKEGKDSNFETYNGPKELSQIAIYLQELTDKMNQWEWEKKYLDKDADETI